MEKWYVNYTVDYGNGAGPTDFVSGPYPEKDIDLQVSDIKGYCGISNCYKTTFLDPKRQKVGNQ